jgi:hypothetical protein
LRIYVDCLTFSDFLTNPGSKQEDFVVYTEGSDDENAMLNYWLSIWEASIADNVLTLPNSYLIARNTVPAEFEGSQLYVRQCYYELAQLLLNEDTLPYSVMTGTPGWFSL